MFDFIPTRIVIGALSYLGFFFLYMTRFNMSVMIVEMAKLDNSSSNCHDNGTSYNVSEHSIPCSHDAINTSTEKMVWSESMKGLVLGSFFYGYACTQIVGGRLAELYGTKIIFGLAVTVPGILTYLIPVGAKCSAWILVCVRILQGLFQGMSFPAMHVLLSHWIPIIERSRYVGIIYLASSFSLVVTMPLVGAIIDSISWEAAAYITGTFPILWGFLWFAFMYDRPELHPRIKAEELRYIEESIAESGTCEYSKLKVPVRSILTSIPFLAIVVCDAGNSYGMTLFTTMMPQYIKSAFPFSLSKIGFLSSLPFLLRYIGAILSSIIADWSISREKLTVVLTRKIFASIAMFGPALFVLILIYEGTTVSHVVALSCCALFLNGSIASSQLVNHTDIAPNFSGTLFGISNTASSIPSFICPIVAGIILDQGSSSDDQWKVVFWIVIPVYTLTGLIFLIFAQGSPQPWNFPKKSSSYELQSLSESTVSENSISENSM